MYRFFASRFIHAATLLIALSVSSRADDPLVGTLAVDVSVDNKGAANASIPLQIPAGRSGLQPKLSLNYNSQSGNGPLGIGWSISTGFPQGITRGRSILARDGVVRGVNFNADDKFYLDGKRLICVAGSYGAPESVYRTEVDSFVSITASGTGSDAATWNIDSFLLIDKAGRKLTFGKHASGNDAYQKGGGEPADKAYVYALKKAEDPIGNYVTFTYSNSTAGEHLLSQIAYTGGAGISPEGTIDFAYENRDDKPRTFVCGRYFDRTQRLKTVQTRISAVDVSTYVLNYDYAPNYGASRLVSLQPSFADPASSNAQSVNLIQFSMQDGVNEAAAQSFNLTNAGGDERYVQSGDFDGDGKDEYVSTAMGNHFLLSGDFDGDGKKDQAFFVVPSYGNVSGILFSAHLATGGVITLDSSSFQDPFTNEGSPNNVLLLEEGECISSRLTVADFTGDGRDDLLVHGFDGHLNLFESTGGAFRPVIRSAYQAGGRGQLPNATNVYSAHINPHAKLHFYVRPMPCDINGDGRMDYAFVENLRTVSYDSDGFVAGYNNMRWVKAVISLPEGGFSKASTLAMLRIPLGNTSTAQEMKLDDVYAGVLPGDFNGDGLGDFLVLNSVTFMTHYRWFLLLSKGTTTQYGPEFEGFAGIIPNTTTVAGEDLLTYFKPCTDSQWFGMKLPRWAFEPTYAPLFSAIESGGAATNAFIKDVNRDGLSDYVWYVAANSSDSISTNKGWYAMLSTGKFTAGTTAAPGAGFVGPVRLDFLNRFDGGTPAGLGNGGPQFTSLNVNHSLDLNGDGHGDYVFRSTINGRTSVSTPSAYLARHSDGASPAPWANVLTSVTNGLGVRSRITYKAAKDLSVYSPGAATAYPVRDLRSSAPVVSDIYKDSGEAATTSDAHYSYQYSGNRLDLSGRGALGFHSFVTLDHQTNLFKYQFLTQSFPMTGLTAREQTYRYWGASGQAHFRLLTSHDNVVVFDEVVDPANSSPWGTVYPFMSQATESRWENSDTAHFSLTPATASSQPELVFSKLRPANPHIAITAKSWFDNQSLTAEPQISIPSYYASDTLYTGSGYQNIVTGIANYADFDALDFPRKITHGNLRQLETDFGDGFTEKVVTTYQSPTSNGLTGLVDTVTTSVSSSTHGTETAPVKSYTYWTSGATPTPLVATETVNATDDALDLTTTYTRDTLGRVTETAISGFDSPGDLRHIGAYTVSKNTTFDARFDLPTVSENAYGHPTTTVYHPFFGTPTSTTDVNGAEKTSTYDALGRITQARDILKNLQTDTTYAWTTSGASDWKNTQTVSPPAGVTGLSLSSSYAIRTTATVQPAVTAYYDRLSRPLRTIKDGFAGQQTVTDTIYNTLGQVVATSLPYKSGTTPLWTTTTYDPLGRVASVTAPNGTVTTSTYNGRLTAVTVDAADRDPQTNTTYVDAKGRTIKVWNADNIPASPDATTGSTTTASIEFRLDGFGRMRETVLRDQTPLITATYDAFGRQTALNDPDKGNWTYVNNALGQVVQQTDAKLNVTRSTFDPLGRPLSRTTTEPASGPVETANWYYYDTTANISAARHTVALGEKGWIGAPQREDAETTGAPGYAAPPTQKAYYYDAKGRPSITLNTVDSKWFYTHTDYDTYSRPIATRHYWRPPAHELPSDQPYVWQDFGYTYTYNAQSYLLTMGDTAGRTWWQADTSAGYDHLDRPVLVRKGSGHWTQRTYKPEDGTLSALKTGPSAGATAIQNLAFTYDGLGNLAGRTAPSLSETFGYDALNRLTSSSIGGTTTYLANGNIDTKRDLAGNTSAAYQYSATKPHAATTAFGYTMSYDANGNLLTRTGNDTTWSTRWAGFDKPRWLAKTTATATTGSAFTYDANRSRVLHLEFDALSGGVPSHYTRKKVYGLGPTLEVDYKNTAASGTPAWQMDKVRIYVPGPEGTAGTMEFSPFAPSDQDERPLVYHYDHLGSIESITPYGSTATSLATDEAGRRSRFAYDAWGERRNADTWSGAPADTTHGDKTGLTPRGYTGHEMLDDLGLVHMNGRIYDPLLGRMLSADTLVQFPASLQSYNRYSYVMNNPLTFNDPSGHVIPILVWGGYAISVKAAAWLAAGTTVAVIAATPQGRQAAQDASHAVVSGVNQLLESRANANAIQPPAAGDGGQLQNTQTNEMTTQSAPLPNTTASPAPEVSTPQEGFSTAAADVVQEGVTAADPSLTQTTTGSPAPAVDLPMQTDMAKETGSYTNHHESGKTYDGKGDRARSQTSARRVEKETGDTHTATEWKPAANTREALKDESKRLDSHDGAESASNHNKIESPGKKSRRE